MEERFENLSQVSCGCVVSTCLCSATLRCAHLTLNDTTSDMTRQDDRLTRRRDEWDTQERGVGQCCVVSSVA